MSESKIVRPSKWRYTLIFIVLAVLYTFAWNGVQVDIGSFISGLPNIGNMVAQLFPPDLGYFKSILTPMFQTLQMAILGTTFGSIVAIPFTLLASRNVFRSRLVTGIARLILNLVRTVPDLLLASLFVVAVGLGPAAGTLALTVFSFGIVTKLAYESVETIEPGPLEAMTAVGANKWQFIGFAVVPQALPSYVAHILYTFETCVRASAILGLVGAGGIGMALQTAMAQYDYTHVASIIIFTLIIVILIEWISTTLREKLL